MAKTVDNLGNSAELVGRVARKLGNDGLLNDAWYVLDSDKNARTQLVHFANLITVSSGTVPNYQRARDILGDDFISPQDIAEALGIHYTGAQLAELATTLPEKEVLQRARKNGFAVVAGPPSETSLFDIQWGLEDLFYPKSLPWLADKHEEFARSDTVGTTWFVMLKDIFPGSTGKTWNEQQALLSGFERVPNAAEATWFFTIYAKVRGIRLVPDVYLRTSSVNSNGYRVHVGYFDEQGFCVSNFWEDVRDDNLGVASMRK